jgi:hypothetical protein
MDSFHLSMIENMQNMVDKSLGKQVEGDDNVAFGSKTVAPQTPLLIHQLHKQLILSMVCR